MPDDSAVATRPPAEPSAGDPLWDDSETPLRVPAIPVRHVDGFDGPMDLLLDLAERQRIDLGRLSVLAIIEQFVAAMGRLTAHVSVERRADWVVVATRLVLLRSKLMVPASPDAAAEAEREAAHENRAARRVARRPGRRRLAAGPSAARPRRVRAPAGRSRPARRVVHGADGGLPDRAAGQGRRAGRGDAHDPSIAELFRVPDALARMRAKLAQIAGAAPFEAFLPRLPQTTTNRALLARSAVGSTFMAALELARRRTHARAGGRISGDRRHTCREPGKQ